MDRRSLVADCLRDWQELQDGFQLVQETQKQYKQKLEELTKLQSNISSSISRQKKQLKELSLALKKYKSLPDKEQDEDALEELQNMIKERQDVFFEMEAYLPKKNGLYLNLVLGNVNVTLLSKQANQLKLLPPILRGLWEVAWQRRLPFLERQPGVEGSSTSVQ